VRAVGKGVRDDARAVKRGHDAGLLPEKAAAVGPASQIGPDRRLGKGRQARRNLQATPTLLLPCHRRFSLCFHGWPAIVPASPGRGVHEMHSAIRVRCPGCEARIKAPRELLGQMRCCPGCGRRFVIRAKAPADAAPVLSDDDLPAASRLPRAG
jgi:hypothetical protein